MIKEQQVLLVDNDPFFLSIYKSTFEEAGWRVSVADNGSVALTEAKRKKPDVILLEILLPEYDGFAVLRELKKNRETAGIPVVFLTSLGHKEDVEKGLALGAVNYLIKAHCRPADAVGILNGILESH